VPAASNDLIAVADRVAPSNDDDGVAIVLERLLSGH
jgi:hydroxymethylpyrimidine pyrophosphatase-like HAD family hydrolase